MKTSKKPKKPSIKAIAGRYGVSERTVRGWREAGAPLSNLKRLSIWLADRRQSPTLTSGTPEASSARTPKRTSTPTPLATGAAHALTRLETAEAATYGRLDAAITAGDAMEIRIARKEWLAISESLRKYDMAISESKRVGGQLLPIAEAAQLCGAFTGWLCTALQAAFDQTMPRLTGLRSPSDAQEIIAPLLSETITNAIAACRSGAWYRHPLHPELVDAARDAACSGFESLARGVDTKEMIFRTLFREVCRKMAEPLPSQADDDRRRLSLVDGAKRDAEAAVARYRAMKSPLFPEIEEFANTLAEQIKRLDQAPVGEGQ